MSELDQFLIKPPKREKELCGDKLKLHFLADL